MSGQQEGSVILVPEHLAREVSQLLSDFISDHDDALTGRNIAGKIRRVLGRASGDHNLPLLSSLFALWNALPGSIRQAARERLILPGVQALTTAYGLCRGVIPEETSPSDTPETLLQAVVTGLQKLWLDSCGCPECQRCVRGLGALTPGLFELPKIIPHTKKCNPVNLLNTLVHKAVALGGQVKHDYDPRGLTPGLDEIPDLDDSDGVLARTLLAALFHLSLFFILRDYVTGDSQHLKQALGGQWLAETGDTLPVDPQTLRDYIEQYRKVDNHFYFPTPGPLNPFHFPETLLGRILVTEPNVCAAKHVVALVKQGGGGGVPRPMLPALPQVAPPETGRPCSHATRRGMESSQRNLGPPLGTSPDVSPICPAASPAPSEPQRPGKPGLSLPTSFSCPVAPVASLLGDYEEAAVESSDSRSLPSSDGGMEEFEAWLEAQEANFDEVQREFSGLRVTGEEADDGSYDEGEFSDLDLSDSDHEGDDDEGDADGGGSLRSLYSLSAI
ncbi:BRRF2 [Macacine gammaherpesvirus 4]|uniref:BRRF2 n=1 Tax=Macacine gammaherpesvirus 4 TaxID=45455 RepID=Q8UZH1_9GAMA|nr:BRRF2 [Macacine gammaherpesvirus 4]AAK95439.1 BRRF2 [Macacine gammaherpesvirus 4]